MVTFKIEEGQQYRVGSVDFQTTHRARSTPSRCAASRASTSARSTTPKRSRNPSRKCRSRPRAAATPSRSCVRAATAISSAHRLDRLLDRRRPAHLYRAHQRPRQHPHPRLRDPPRVRSLRRRRLQPRAGRSRRAPAEEPRLLQEREDRDRARLIERSRDPDRRSRREIDRRLLGVGRLFDHRRRARRSQHLRTQLPRPRPVRQGVGAPTASMRAATRCRSSSLICWTIASRSASTCSSASSWPTAISPTAPRRSASARGSASACAKICRCSCAIRSISRRSAAGHAGEL